MYNYKQQDETIKKLFALFQAELDFNDFFNAAEGMLNAQYIRFKSDQEIMKEIEALELEDCSREALDTILDENEEYQLLIRFGSTMDLWESRINNLLCAKDYELFKTRTIDLIDFSKTK